MIRSPPETNSPEVRSRIFLHSLDWRGVEHQNKRSLGNQAFQALLV
ncbi:hypothetical protein AP9108_06555 [Arthrospira sp. PCC 9108]|nr:hypothetical protein AP9108_06555 [Arthrospira sp. PCC 9108]